MVPPPGTVAGLHVFKFAIIGLLFASLSVIGVQRTFSGQDREIWFIWKASRLLMDGAMSVPYRVMRSRLFSIV